MQDIKNGDRIAVRLAFNRIQRFRVKEVKDVKAGGFTNLGSLEYWLHQSNCRK